MIINQVVNRCVEFGLPLLQHADEANGPRSSPRTSSLLHGPGSRHGQAVASFCSFSSTNLSVSIAAPTVCTCEERRSKVHVTFQGTPSAQVVIRGPHDALKGSSIGPHYFGRWQPREVFEISDSSWETL